MQNNETRIVETDIGNKDGQNKCPKCGATDISINPNTGKLRCEFCRHEFEPEKISGMVTNIEELQGQVIGSGAQDIIADTNDVLTFKCSSCGAEVVIDTSSASQARCHWCRNTLSVNQQIPNGSIPDAVLPFSITKEIAKQEIEKFVGKRKFFAHPKFKSEFTTNNIMGVYFSYLLVDINAHAYLKGEGEKQTRKYYRGSGNNREVRFDADLYRVERDFDITINGLSIESNSNRLTNNVNQTNNVINSIMPFDIENCVKYNANYLKGYTSERRDTNIDDLKGIINTQSKDIVRIAANETIQDYDRGVQWQNEQMEVKGEQWKAAYLPVWLYSYQEVKGNEKILHYVAVNARTKETMGSVPIHIPKLVGISFLVEIVGILAMIFIDWDYSFIFILAGFIYFITMFLKYRNLTSRHTYETDTKSNITNVNKNDNFIKSETGLKYSTMTGANNNEVNGKSATNKVLEALSGQNIEQTVLNSITDNSPIASLIKDNINKKGNDE